MPGYRLRVGEQPPADYYEWIEPEDPDLLGYVIDGKLLVLANAGEQDAVFEDVELPQGDWQLIGNGVQFDHEQGVAETGDGRQRRLE